MSSSFIFLAIMMVFLVIFSPGLPILRSQGSHWRTWRDPGHVEAVHGHGESVYGLVVQGLPTLLIAGLQAEDEDDDGHDDADHDSGGGRDDDVVESLGAAANSLRPDLATLLERDGAGSDLHLLQ